METLGFVPPAVPVAVPIATGLLGAAAALVKPLVVPPLPAEPGVFQPKPDGVPWGAANTQPGGGQKKEFGSEWTDKARDVEITLTATQRTSDQYNQQGDKVGDANTRTTTTTKRLSDVYGFTVETREATMENTAGNPDPDYETYALATIVYWKVAEPEDDDKITLNISTGNFLGSNGTGGGSTNTREQSARADEISIDGRLFPIPNQPGEMPVIGTPELFVPAEPEQKPDRKAPPLPGSPPPQPARPPLPSPVPDAPPFPVPGTPAQPDPNPGGDPATSPSPAPKPSAPPERLPASPVPAEPPALDPAVTQQTNNGGGIIRGTPGLTPTTPADAHYPVPGKDPVRGSSANSSPEAMAQELQRVEYKLNALMDSARSSKPDWLLDLLRIIPFIEYLYDLFTTSVEGGAYEVEEKCQGNSYPDGVIPSRTVTFPEAADPLEGILERLDALGDLAQANFDLKVNTCKSRPKLEGEWVTVNFISDENSPNNNRPLRKLLRYRDLSGSSAADHSRHWDGFEWDAGSVCVIHSGASWGTPQCWAASESEGKRVLRFAASIAGIDPDKNGQWQTAISSNSRYGQSGRMRVAQVWGFNSVSKRDGSNGPPTLHD